MYVWNFVICVALLSLDNTGDKQPTTEVKMLHQGDNNMQTSGKWREEVCNPNQALADQDERIRQSIMRWKWRSAFHTVAVNQLNSTKAELEESNRKCVALEEQLQQQQASHRRELLNISRKFQQQLSEQEQRCFQEISRAEESSRYQLLEQQRWFNEELSKKDELMKLQFSINEDIFKKQLSDESAKLNKEHADREEAMKKQLSDQKESLRSTLAELCHQSEVRAQQWSHQQRRLEEMLEEKEKTVQLQEEASKLEIQHLQEEIIKLKVSTC